MRIYGYSLALTSINGQKFGFLIYRAKLQLNGGKLPRMDALKAEGRELAAKKKAAYGEYRAARKDMQEVITAKANIDHLLGLTDGQRIEPPPAGSRWIRLAAGSRLKHGGILLLTCL